MVSHRNNGKFAPMAVSSSTDFYPPKSPKSIFAHLAISNGICVLLEQRQQHAEVLEWHEAVACLHRTADSSPCS